MISDEIDNFLKLLTEAPRRIAAVTKGATEARLDLRTKKEPWSVNDILAHLRASADVREKFINVMLTENNPTLRYISPRSYIKRTNYLELPFSESFQSYKKQRAELLDKLKKFPVKDWSRSAIIKERKETVLSYIKYLTDHETAHCEQIEKLLK